MEIRQIIFRGKTKENGWVYWNELGIIDFILTDEEIALYVKDLTDELIPETVGQFTGLTDKNDTKIFEGDIVKQTLHIGKHSREIISVIEYGIDLRAYCVCQRFRDGSGKTSLTVQNEKGIVCCEVIGNIHDNPELLKEEL